jgi:hypothetical protein
VILTIVLSRLKMESREYTKLKSRLKMELYMKVNGIRQLTRKMDVVNKFMQAVLCMKDTGEMINLMEEVV